MNTIKNILSICFLCLLALNSFSQNKSISKKFLFTVKVDTSLQNNETEVYLTIQNRSLKTVYISNHNYKNSYYLSDSICGFSLNYTENYSDPLLIPNMEISFYRLKPYGKICVSKTKKNKVIKQVTLDFDYFIKSQLKKNKTSYSIKKDKLYIEMIKFYKDIYQENGIELIYKKIELY